MRFLLCFMEIFKINLAAIAVISPRSTLVGAAPG